MPAAALGRTDETVTALARQSLQHNNLDDRREIVYLLGKLSPARRMRFLRECCAQCQGPMGDRVRPTRGTRGDDLEVFFDLWALAMQYGLDMTKVSVRLEEIVSRAG